MGVWLYPEWNQNGKALKSREKLCTYVLRTYLKDALVLDQGQGQQHMLAGVAPGTYIVLGADGKLPGWIRRPMREPLGSFWLHKYAGSTVNSSTFVLHSFFSLLALSAS